MLIIDTKYQPLILEALEELMYKIALQQNELKGKPLDRQRKELTQKQKEVENLQHLISTYGK